MHAHRTIHFACFTVLEAVAFNVKCRKLTSETQDFHLRTTLVEDNASVTVHVLACV